MQSTSALALLPAWNNVTLAPDTTIEDARVDETGDGEGLIGGADSEHLKAPRHRDTAFKRREVRRPGVGILRHELQDATGFAT